MCHKSVFTHVETACKLTIDSMNWRACYYLLIEHFREKISISATIRDRTSRVITEGVDFYTKLIRDIETSFLNFTHEQYIDVNYFDRCQKIIRKMLADNRAPELKPTIKSKHASFALMILQRSLISIGDLERYREMFYGGEEIARHLRNYSEARDNYRKAMFVAPKNPRPFHQLAILSVVTKRRLDACYYFLR